MSNLSSIKSLSGKTTTMGSLSELPSPIELDPLTHKGSMAFGIDGEMYFSDGQIWKLPLSRATVIPPPPPPITKPYALTPTTKEERTRLRLSAMVSPAGLLQDKVVFKASSTPDFTDSLLFTKIITSSISGNYQVVLPDDGILPGASFWWMGMYVATTGEQSLFSEPFQQTYPAAIDTPKGITPIGEVAAALTISEFVSFTNLNYHSTELEIYDLVTNTAIATLTVNTGSSVAVPSNLEDSTSYSWRARYAGREGASSVLTYSAWSTLRLFVGISNTMILKYDMSKGTGTTINLPLAFYAVPDTGLQECNVVVDWGDGTTESFTTGGNKPHTYANPLGVFTVKIRGRLSQFGSTTDQTKLVEVISFGADIGLRSLAYGFSKTKFLTSVSSALPPSVTTLNNLFSLSTANPTGISAWNVSAVTNMSYMFQSASAFNQNIGAWNVSAVTNMSYMFQSTAAFNQNIGAWTLNKSGVILNGFYINGMDIVNYSKLLVSWANKARINNGPFNVSMSVLSRKYDSTVYEPGSAFPDALSARTYLTSLNSVEVTGSSNASANGIYSYNGTRYQNTAGCYFSNVSLNWTLYDSANAVQATGSGTALYLVANWTGVLQSLAVSRLGASWTITGDTLQ